MKMKSLGVPAVAAAVGIFFGGCGEKSTDNSQSLGFSQPPKVQVIQGDVANQIHGDGPGGFLSVKKSNSGGYIADVQSADFTKRNELIVSGPKDSPIFKQKGKYGATVTSAEHFEGGIPVDSLESMKNHNEKTLKCNDFSALSTYVSKGVSGAYGGLYIGTTYGIYDPSQISMIPKYEVPENVQDEIKRSIQECVNTKNQLCKIDFDVPSKNINVILEISDQFEKSAKEKGYNTYNTVNVPHNGLDPVFSGFMTKILTK